MEKKLNIILVFILSAILLGAFGVQFIKKEEPCILCMLQRLAMIGVASGALMNAKFGSRKAHYGISLLFTVMGSIIALRQISLHICPGFPIFGTPILGLSLYTWSFLIFLSSITYLALIFLLCDKRDESKEKESAVLTKSAFILILIISFANMAISLFTP